MIFLRFSIKNYYNTIKSTRGAMAIGEIMNSQSAEAAFCVRLVHEHDISMTEPGLDQHIISHLIHVHSYLLHLINNQYLFYAYSKWLLENMKITTFSVLIVLLQLHFMSMHKQGIVCIYMFHLSPPPTFSSCPFFSASNDKVVSVWCEPSKMRNN